MLRKNSTYALPNAWAALLGSVRRTPIVEPNASARSHANKAVTSVQRSPESSMSR
jgi:hypothetical protein